MTDAPAAAGRIPAATLVLLRMGPGAGPETLMIERAASMRFAAGAMVFPGGRVEPGDVVLARATAPDGDAAEYAARVAAIRETIEEAGIAVGLVPAPDAATVARVRQGLAGGADFAELLAAAGLTLDLLALVPFARWCPEGHHSRVFDTFFFVAAAPPGAVARADGGESVRAVWATARTFLAEADAGRHPMIFPTRRNLERVAALESIEAARLLAETYPVTTPIVPWIEQRDGEAWLCIPDDRGYPVTAQRMAEARRG